MTALMESRLRAAEFFAGMGLVRVALAQAGLDVVWANDVSAVKRDLYAANFSDGEFLLEDIREVRGDDLPDCDLATASFPCVDLSLAGRREGLAGAQSGLFWEFARCLDEMADRRPKAVLLENVPSFLTSNEGRDFVVAVAELNRLGYSCDAFVIDARRFVPQSRPRLFVVGTEGDGSSGGADFDGPSETRPLALHRMRSSHPSLDLVFREMPPLPSTEASLRDVVEHLSSDDSRWWDDARLERFTREMSDLHAQRLSALVGGEGPTWATAYRRTRHGRPVWEVRADAISGCLRTARGGSSKQAVIEAGNGRLRVRWMTPREYARLQGVPDTFDLGAVTPNQALFGLGDAVCVPAVTWVVSRLVVPRVLRSRGAEHESMEHVAP